MRSVAFLLLLAAAAWADEPEGRRPIIPPNDPFPWCGTGRVWTGPLRVRVVSGRRPVEGIEVVLGSGIGCTTDGKGIARFQSADSTDTLRIREIGYFPFEKGVPDADEELLVELRPGIPVRGRVLLADGTRARGARAACWDEYGLRMLDAAQVVDEYGRFVIAAVDRRKPFRLMVSLPGLAPIVLRKALVREEPELNLTLGGPGGIEGVVTPPTDVVYVRAAQGQNPLRLDRGDELQRESIEMETAFAHPDALGRYRIEGLPLPGAYVVCAGPNESKVVELSAERPRATVNLASATGPRRLVRVLDDKGIPLACEWIPIVGETYADCIEASVDGVIELPPGEWSVDVDGYLPTPSAPEVRLDRGITLRGVVCYPDGSPAPDVGMCLQQSLPGGRYRASSTPRSDEHGRFEISGLMEGEGWLLAGRPPEYPEDGRIRIRRDMKEVRLGLPAPVRVVGRIEPPPTGVVQVGEPADATLRVGGDGSFRVDVRAGWAQVLTLSLDEGRSRFDLFFPDGSTADAGTLRVHTAATITGVVEDLGGSAIGGAGVHVAFGEPYEPTWTDDNGAFSVPVRPVLPVVLEAGAPGFATRYVPVEKPDGGPVKIVLDPGGLVRGRVVDRTGRAVPGAYIVFWRRLASGRLSPLEDWKPDTDSAGQYEIRLPPGTYHARFYDMRFSHARIPGPDVTVRGGETIDLEIRLP